MSTSIVIPEKFICPISYMIFLDPVIASDGRTYERECIVKWMNSNDNRSPFTNQTLCQQLYNNIGLKNEIDEWITSHPEQKTQQFISTATTNVSIHRALQAFTPEEPVHWEGLNNNNRIEISYTPEEPIHWEGLNYKYNRINILYSSTFTRRAGRKV